MKKILALLTVITFTSCASIYVNYDYEKQTDFTKYKTYNYYSDIESGLSELDTKRLLDACLLYTSDAADDVSTV